MIDVAREIEAALVCVAFVVVPVAGIELVHHYLPRLFDLTERRPPRYFVKKLDADFCVIDRNENATMIGYPRERDARSLAKKLNTQAAAERRARDVPDKDLAAAAPEADPQGRQPLGVSLLHSGLGAPR